MRRFVKVVSRENMVIFPVELFKAIMVGSKEGSLVIETYEHDSSFYTFMVDKNNMEASFDYLVQSILTPMNVTVKKPEGIKVESIIMEESLAQAEPMNIPPLDFDEE